MNTTLLNTRRVGKLLGIGLVVALASGIAQAALFYDFSSDTAWSLWDHLDGVTDHTVTYTWDSGNEDMDLAFPPNWWCWNYPTDISERGATNPVTLTVKQADTGVSGYIYRGLGISATQTPVGSSTDGIANATYIFSIYHEDYWTPGGDAHFVVRAKNISSAGWTVLQTGASLGTGPPLPFTMGIERNGDNYDFTYTIASVKTTFYTASTYTAAVHDTMTHMAYAGYSGGMGSPAVDTIDDFGVVSSGPAATPGTLIYGK